MTTERDGKSRRTARPDLLASLPDERPAPGIDPAAFEELRTAVQDIGEQLAGLREAASAERLAPEALEAWGDKLCDPGRRGGADSGRASGRRGGRYCSRYRKDRSYTRKLVMG